MSDLSHWSSNLPSVGIRAAACSLAWLAAGTGLAKDPHCIYSPHDYVRAARYSYHRAFEMQAQEGKILTSTMWNHHFYSDSEELRPSGREQLERLVRRSIHSLPNVYLQSAHDIPISEGDHEGYFARRSELNELRIKTVNDYMQRLLQGQQVAIQIHDRPPVGMMGDEAAKSYIRMVRQAPQGTLSGGITYSNRFEIEGSGFDTQGGGGDLGGGDLGGGGGVSMDLGGGGAPDFSSQIPVGGPGPGGPGPGGPGPGVGAPPSVPSPSPGGGGLPAGPPK